MKCILDKEKHVYKNETGIIVPSYSEIISACNFTDWSKIPEFYRNRACDLGSAVHSLTEFYDRLTYPDNEGRTQQYAESLQKWLFEKYQLEVDLSRYLNQWVTFLEEYKIEKFDYIEEAFASEKYFYATTIDRFYKHGIYDIKTGGKYNTHKLQTAAQCCAMLENNIKVHKRYNVYLKEDSYEVEEHRDNDDLNKWETCVNFYNLKKVMTK